MNTIIGYLLAAILFLSSEAHAQFYIGPSGSDNNPGTLLAPFATFPRAQQAMRNSSVKTTYVLAGTYHPAPIERSGGDTVALYLDGNDTGQTWSYYAPDGIGSAIIDGGSSSASTGIKRGINIQGGSNIIINGLQLQHFSHEMLHAGWDTSGPAPNITFINNIVHDNYAPLYTGLINVFGNAPYATIANNFVYNAAGHGVVLQACGANCVSGGTTGGVIKNNFIYNTCMSITDCGAIYLQDYASPRSTNMVISHNFVRDVTTTGNDSGGRGIYLDDGTSNVTVSGNIVAGAKFTCFNIHGGDNDVFDGNVCDLQSSGNQRIALIQTSDLSSTAMVGNAFTNNIVIANGGAGGGYWSDTVPSPATIMNNAYWSYSGGPIKVTGAGTGGSDPNPTFKDPQLSTWCYAIASTSPVFAQPVRFPGMLAGWGYPGFVVPSMGTPPSSPDRTACGNSGNTGQTVSATLSAAPSSMVAGSTSTLTWGSTAAYSCTGIGFSTGGAISGQALVAPLTSTSYTVTCTGSTSASASTPVTIKQPPATFVLGSAVQTTTSAPVYKKLPGTRSLCSQPIGSLGTIAGGPKRQSGYSWWNVNFAAGCDGWIIEDDLALLIQ